MTRIVFITCMFALFTTNVFSETWISVNNQSVKMRHATRCSKIGDENLAATCDCCLIKKSTVRNLSPENAIARCERSGKCIFPNQPADLVIANARKNLAAMTIVRIETLINAPVLPKNGALASEDVGKILLALHDNGHLVLHNALTTEPGRLKITSLSEKAGRYSGQLFSIQYDASYVDQQITQSGTFKPLYILKESKKGISEIAHLHRVSSSPLKAEKIVTRDRIQGLAMPSSNTIAQIAFDELHFKLKNNGTTRYFSLLQTAPGQSFHRHLTEFGKIAKSKYVRGQEFMTALERMNYRFYRLGFSMSELHQKYAYPKSKNTRGMGKTFIHGDLHSENVFFDDITDTITLIDNETFALSLKRPSSGINDIVEFYLLHTVRTLAHRFTNQLTMNQEFGIDDELWHELWRSLLNGYFTAFGNLSTEDFEKLYDDFRKEFFDGFSNHKSFRSMRDLKDQRKLKRLRIVPSPRLNHLMRFELVQLFDQVRIDWLNQHEPIKNML